MKKDIHPKVNTSALVTCVCGNSFTTISTLDTINVEICSNCHPFYSGQQKFVDTEGRIDKFKKKQALATQKKEKAVEISKAKAEKPKKAVSNKQPTLKEMLEQARTSA